jgi:hypothetical protein
VRQMWKEQHIFVMDGSWSQHACIDIRTLVFWKTYSSNFVWFSLHRQNWGMVVRSPFLLWKEKQVENRALTRMRGCMDWKVKVSRRSDCIPKTLIEAQILISVDPGMQSPTYSCKRGPWSSNWRMDHRQTAASISWSSMSPPRLSIVDWVMTGMSDHLTHDTFLLRTRTWSFQSKPYTTQSCHSSNKP